MGLTYDGITYRSLEEQVRYDAEQVQLLKQADVTINESLQTINTELDGKLTKPTNPSAESAVTMLSDGTVRTKPLSEIGGGGGGKLYRHDIQLIKNNNGLSALMVVYSSIGNSFTGEQRVAIAGKSQIVFVNTYESSTTYGVCEGYFLAESVIQLYGVFCKTGSTPELRYGSPISLDSVTDTVTEL